MKYNLIGDIHGRSTWQQLVREDAINVFLGDYLDPYHGEGIIPGEEEYANLLAIIRYKQEHPETVLLLGNHDLHYLWHEHYSRYNAADAERFAQLFRDHLHFFQAAYAIGNRILVTHAGVTRPWCELAGIEEGLSVAALAEAICQRMTDEKQRHLFTADSTFEMGDYCGMSATASPLWVRPQALVRHGELLDDQQQPVIQVVGHTQIQEVMSIFPFYFVDCLGYQAQSLQIELTDDGQIIPTVNRV
jgi:hypothetical protein